MYEIVEEYGPVLFFNGIPNQCESLLKACESGTFRLPVSKLRLPEPGGKLIERTADQVLKENFVPQDLIDAMGENGVLGVVSHSMHFPRVLRMYAAAGLENLIPNVKGFPVRVKGEHLMAFAFGELKGILAYTLINKTCALNAPEFI